MPSPLDLILNAAALPPRVHAVISENDKAIVAWCDWERQAVSAAGVHKKRNIRQKWNFHVFDVPVVVSQFFSDCKLDRACLPLEIHIMNDARSCHTEIDAQIVKYPPLLLDAVMRAVHNVLHNGSSYDMFCCGVCIMVARPARPF